MVVRDWKRACAACPRDGDALAACLRCIVHKSVRATQRCFTLATPSLCQACSGCPWRWPIKKRQPSPTEALQLPTACAHAQTRQCPAAVLASCCYIAASLVRYSCFASRTASVSAGSSSSQNPSLGHCHTTALEDARSIVAHTLPQGHTGEMYVLPLGAGASVFEQLWAGGRPRRLLSKW